MNWKVVALSIAFGAAWGYVRWLILRIGRLEGQVRELNFRLLEMYRLHRYDQAKHRADHEGRVFQHASVYAEGRREMLASWHQGLPERKSAPRPEDVPDQEPLC